MKFRKLKLWLAAGIMALSVIPANMAVAESESEAATAGTVCEGTAEGRNGEIKVSVTLDENAAITDITTTAEETPGVGDVAIEQLTAQIIENQSIALDAVSGATLSSEGFLAAVEDALSKSGAEIAEYKGEVSVEKGEDITVDTDIVVVGAGGAGAKVVVLEKMSAIGGNTRVGEGTYNVADPELLESTGTKTTEALEQEVEDAIAVETDDEAYASLIADVAADFEAWKESGTDTLFDSPNWHALQTYTGGGEIGNLDLIRTYATKSVDTLSWLVDDIGVQFKTDYIFMAIGGKWTRGHQIDLLAATGAEGDNGGNVYITKLKERTDANGVEIYTDAKVTKILMDENGRACGQAVRSAARATESDWLRKSARA